MAARLRRTSAATVVLVGNKVDATHNAVSAAGEFVRLGFGEPVLVSAQHGRGIPELVQAVLAHLPPASSDLQPDDGAGRIHLALVGRTNVGKSSLLNRLARAERVIVSEVPGTTRDAIDVRFELGGHVYVAIDTAGMRRRSKLGNSVDYYSQVRAERSIRRCDVALLLIDASETISAVDKSLAAYIREQVKPCILVVNKWDLARDESARPEDYERYLRAHIRGFEFAPIALVSARTGFNVAGLLDLARSLYEQAGARVTTADLNRMLDTARERPLPRHRRGKRPKIFYGTQVQVHPPTFVIVVNDPELFDARFTRYFENRLRDAFSFAEVPLKIHFRSRREEGEAPRYRRDS